METRPVVFIVDDEPVVLDSLRALLKVANWDVRTYLSAEEFLGDYDGSHPACLVLDVRMPGMSGLELQKHLEKQRIDLPIIFISGHGDVSSAVESMKAGAVDFLEKPFDGETLLERVRRILEPRERPGILTRVTRQLSTREARELFNGLSTRLVLGILFQLDWPANVRTVRQISEHLCRSEVQDRLRAREHMRDGIADELCGLLGEATVEHALTRDVLMKIIQKSGAMNDLAAMEACLLRIEAA